MVLRCILILIFVPFTLSNPTGCTYSTDILLYSCDSRLWVLPLDYSQFTVQPQRLLIKDMSGELAASAPNGPVFSGFSAINTALFDVRFPPSLHIMCVANGFLMMVKDAFQDFGWVEELIIQDCDILSLPAQVFAHFGDLNSLIIEGGSMDAMVADTFYGLNVNKMSSAVTPKGELILRNTEIIGGALPYGGLFTQSNVSTIVLDNIHLSSLRTDTFYNNLKLTNLSISYNALTSIPDNLFIQSQSLQYVRIYGIPWACACSSLGFIPYVINNNITLEGDIICTSPANYANQRAAVYYVTNCISYDVCAGQTGFVSGGKCITVLDIISYVLFVLNTIIACIAFGLVLHLFLRLKEIKDKRRGFMLRRMFGVEQAKTKTFNVVKPRDPSFD
ncbi:uncharacterized protein LOC134701207 [Mytilus trossulus]|uniref:uncharacterized protein LOC134701207 n=1 Tax=Mytilus trossulus TaxID=6551 RepID=UPI0030077798